MPTTLDDPQEIAASLAAVARIEAVPTILRVICESTGTRFAVVARVAGDSWIACAVRDEIGFGIGVGDRLDVQTTLCNEIRRTGQPVAFAQASHSAAYLGRSFC